MTNETTKDRWREVADGVFIRRYDPCDVTVTAIRGGDGLAVIDTRCSLVEGAELREHLSQLSTRPVRWVINTHVHFDHTWGNHAFVEPPLDPPAEIWGHRRVPVAMADPRLADFKKRVAAEDAEWAAKIAALVEVAPTHLVDDEHVLDLGDRAVELRHLGRGHTDGDLLIAVPDARLVVCGDLIEEAGPPSYNADSYPLDWPQTLRRLLESAAPDSVFLPGHGEPVDTAFVTRQQQDTAAIAREIQRLHGEVPADQALAAGTWPIEWPEHQSSTFIEAAYARIDAQRAAGAASDTPES